MRKKKSLYSATHADDFLTYSENNIIYASYLITIIPIAFVEVIKYLSNSNWNTFYLYFVIFIILSFCLISLWYLSYQKKLLSRILQENM